MNNISYTGSAFLVAALILLSGCSLVSESARLSSEDTKMVQSGTIIQGDGFSVRVPEAGLYLVRDSPMHGDLCLRMRGDWPGGSYNVYPFSLSTPGHSLQEAWQAHIREHMAPKARMDYRILFQHTNVWQGSDAWFHTGYIPANFLTANCVTRHGTNYYWIVRSIGLLADEDENIARDSSDAEHDLQTFLDGFQFDPRPPMRVEGSSPK
jgi:hypothetical protein